MTLKQIYVNKFKELVKKERDHEINFHKEEIKKLGIKRENVGRAILNLNGKVIREFFGEYIVRYGRSEKFKKTDISVGDIVLISKGNPLQSDLLGTVIEIGSNHVDVSMEIVPKWALNDIRIDLYVNDVTFKRMLNALDKFNSTDNRLIDIILSVDSPQKSKTTEIRFLDYRLNEYQKEAVLEALSARDLYLIHGPPGTGKTSTISEVILQEALRKNKVIATADSNIAVDNILSNISKHESFKIVRIGHPSRISKKLMKYSLQNKITEHPNYSTLVKLKTDLQKNYDLRKNFQRPDPKWRRGMSNDDIIIFSKLNKDIRGIPKETIKQMADWVICSENIAKTKENVQKFEKKLIDDIISTSDVVVATNSMAGSEILEDYKFDVCVIDEGSQSTEPSSLIPIVRSRKLIIAGDHKQLPPTVLSDELELKKTLFERMIQDHPEFSKILQVQYRMNEKIMEFSNEMFYENKLIAHESVKSQNLIEIVENVSNEDKDIINEKTLQFINVDGEEKQNSFKSSYNVEEAEKVLEIVSKLQKYEIPVSVITPYDAQVKYISKMLNTDKIDVKSVDGFQGRENEVIVISFVRTSKMGFLKDLRRLNVAVTRAKRKLIVVGSKNLLIKDDAYSKFLNCFNDNQ
ncbi:IGHMBP2 family helicase [Methanococcus maripaludis]|uniref:Putative DNA helicase n=3 Tax=Methanococcus maripaludis TaxID=39152 RepID=A0A2Z5PHQ2_METMI|nr:IGHMBP2 family helicase [Methanococcus maripaludis]AEK20605.1 putative DNA helicase [Methanococcus maripaludis X1]BAP61928.1 putative DNA helicase [Methanococcus maripaludis KA1]BAP63779.1 putative DNA helicase [Methanococcus maripaludis OS7]